MSLQTSPHDRHGYLLIEMEGNWEFADVKRHIEAVRHEADQRGYRRVLTDMRSVAPPSREIERFFADEHIARVWGCSLRVAIVWLSRFVTRFGEDTAVDRGADMRVFGDAEQALPWLLQSGEERRTRGARPLEGSCCGTWTRDAER